MGRLNASIPRKCIDQMPTPIEKAPPTSHARALFPLDAVMRVVRSSAVYDASMATSIDTATRP